MDSDFTFAFEAGKSPWTLLLLHGTGGDENDLIPLGRQLGPEANLLSPRGKVLENGVHRRFFRRLDVGRLDIPDLLERSDELADFVGDAVAEHSLDPDRIVAVGLSNGANIAASLLFRHPGLLRGAILLRAMLPYEPDASPDLAGTSVRIAAGERDPYAPLDQVERLTELLQGYGTEVDLSVTTGAGHGLTPAEIGPIATWANALLGHTSPSP